MKRKINNAVNRQEDEDGDALNAGIWIMDENEHSKKEPLVRKNQISKVYGAARLGFRSYIRSLRHQNGIA